MEDNYSRVFKVLIDKSMKKKKSLKCGNNISVSL